MSPKTNKNSSEVTLLLDKLYTIDKELGGNASKMESAKTKGTEFEVIKEQILELQFQLKKKQDERDEKEEKFGRDVDNIKLNMQIKEALRKDQEYLNEMNRVLKKQYEKKNKFPLEEVQKRDEYYQTLKKAHENIEEREQGGTISNNTQKIKTLTEYKQQLLKEAEVNNRNIRLEMNDDEKEFVKRAEERKMQEDQDIENNILPGLNKLHDKANTMGGRLVDLAAKEEVLKKEIQGTTIDLISSNKRLKEIVTKYRQPSKFCLDIVLLLVLLGFATVIYTMVKK